MSQTPAAGAYLPPTPPAPLSPDDQRLWATLVHVGGLVIGFWASLIGYLVLKDRGDFVRQHARTALNFHITMLIALAAGFILSLVFIGFFVIFAVYVVIFVFSILAAIAANRGQLYRYPLTIEFIK